MDMGKIYHDSEGNECSILQAVKREPEWAASRIQEGEKAIEGNKWLTEQNKNEFINGVASTLAYILDNGEAIPEEELQRIGAIVLERRGIEDEPHPLQEVIDNIMCIEEEGHNFSSDDTLARIFNMCRDYQSN